jgi:Zn-dependent protease
MNLDEPLFWAVFIGWVMSVVLHELAHGVVGYLGGDYTIKERGGLSLNPLQYVDPLMSIVLPAVMLAVGGTPLPGGVTYVDRSLLRSRWWESAMSLAGPAMNFGLFLLLALPLHPAVGWVRLGAGEQPTNFHHFLGAMVFLQFFTALFNLIPVPPLDGFQMVAAHLGERVRRLSAPPIGYGCLILFFLLLRGVRDLWQRVFDVCGELLFRLGFDYDAVQLIRVGFNTAMRGSSS